MSERSVSLQLKINFPLIFSVVLLMHLLLLLISGVNPFQKLVSSPSSENERTPLKIKNIRTVGARNSQVKDSAYVSKNILKSSEIFKDQFAPVKSKSKTNVSLTPPKSISLSDLTENKPVKATIKPEVQRPGTRPLVAQEKSKALNAIALKGSQMRNFLQGSNAAELSGDPRAAGLNNSDILVNLEVPEGVHPDELNKYELMFYGFQRRTAINYINAFYKNLDKFQRENPHLHFPLTESKQVMTGRLTYDQNGNVKQIKMIRWTNVERLQDFFVDVLKDMDTLHNPPQALWEKDGEFSIFFSFQVNG